MKKTFLSFVLFSCFVIATGQNMTVFNNWEAKLLVDGGRIDAVRWLGDSIVVCGTRDKNPGEIFISRDYGRNWAFLCQLTSDNISSIAETGDASTFFVLTGSGIVYRTNDFGKTFKEMIKLTPDNVSFTGLQSYSIWVTPLKTLLVSDTQTDGGHIYRSIDFGETWNDLGVISKKGLYRFENIGNGMIINGWDGYVYKSIDDGITWNSIQKLSDVPLYATEYVGGNSALQADEAGNVYLSANAGYSWKKITTLNGAADDMITTSYSTVFYGTYTGNKDVYISTDSGKNWSSIGKLPTVDGDWLDHGVYVDSKDSVFIIAGTNKGYIVRNSFPKELLHKLEVTASKVKHADAGYPVVSYLQDSININAPEDVKIVNNIAYIPCRDGGTLTLVDVSDIYNPKIISVFKDNELIDAMGLDINENYLYLTSMTNRTLLILDISDPLKIRKISSIRLGIDGPNIDRLRKVIYRDNHLFVTHGNSGTLFIVNIADPTRPKLISQVETGDGAFNVYIKDNYAYVGGCGGTSLNVIDISDIKKPKLVKTLQDKINYSCLCSFSSSEDYLYAISYTGKTFVIFDISDPENTKEFSIFKDERLNGANRLYRNGDSIYIATALTDGMVTVNIKDKKYPDIVFDYFSPILDKAYGITYYDGFIFVVGRDADTLVILLSQK